jgi:Protein of unknown function (DUF2656)
MLLSHNFNIADGSLPALSRSEFCAIFQKGLDPLYQCQPVESPHWILEVLMPANSTPDHAGLAVAEALAKARSASIEILILGGIKTTPPTSSLPGALQPGEWGVDVVETADGDEFLRSIHWTETVASRSPDSFFTIRKTACP